MGNLKGDLEKLKRHRDNNIRDSREVVQIWNASISSNIENLGKESKALFHNPNPFSYEQRCIHAPVLSLQWQVYYLKLTTLARIYLKHIVLEQICIAAIDCYQLKIAERCIQELYREFPNSCRVRVLESMFHEADENYSRSLQILNDIIKVDSTNSSARKRKIGICKALGRNSEAIKELVEYLKIFMADVEAWQELSELYLNEHDYGKAAFCVEELILHNPHNHLLHQRYADIKYSQGGLDNIEIARTYYYQALKLNPKNMRALYGIYLSTSALLNNQKNFTGKKKEAAIKIIDWSLKEIKNRYAEASSAEIEKSLAALEI